MSRRSRKRARQEAAQPKPGQIAGVDTPWTGEDEAVLNDAFDEPDTKTQRLAVASEEQLRAALAEFLDDIDDACIRVREALGIERDA